MGRKSTFNHHLSRYLVTECGLLDGFRIGFVGKMLQKVAVKALVREV